MSEPRYWAVVPAAGVGRRMGAAIPKQYLPLAGRPVIEHTLACLLTHPALAGVCVAVGAQDAWWANIEYAAHPHLLRAEGGAERADSVLNALERLAGRADPADWVLVHDAARPCLRHTDIDRLIHEAGAHPVGGVLGVPVRDTMKHAGLDRGIRETVPREGLWHAFTPQMFRLGMLREALREALRAGLPVTDEASAMEHRGLAPLMVEGHPGNIKITRPGDLELAAFYLSQTG